MSLLSFPNICLFCNRSNKSGSVITGVSSTINQFITSLQRFSQTEQTGKTFMIEELLKNEFENILIICEECGTAVDQFCQLYHNLKCLEIQLEWKLAGLEQNIILGRKMSSRVLIFNKVLKAAFNNDYSKISDSCNKIHIFRESVVQTAQERLKISTPRVLLKKKSFAINGQQSSNVNLLIENEPGPWNDSNTNHLKILNVNSTTLASDQPLSFENSEGDNYDHVKSNCPEIMEVAVDNIINIEDAQSNDSFLELDDLPPDLHDGEQFCSVDFNIAKDPKSCSSKVDQDSTQSVNDNDEQANLVQEKSEISLAIQPIPSPASSFVCENVNTNFSSTENSSCSNFSLTGQEAAKMPVSILKTEEGGTQNQADKEVILSNNEPLVQKEFNVETKSLASSSRYDLRRNRKYKSQIVGQTTTRLKCMPESYTSSETSSDSEYYDERDYKRKESRNYCSSETTSESGDTDNDVKLLQQPNVFQKDKTLPITTNNSNKLKRKRQLKCKKQQIAKQLGKEQDTKSVTEDDNEESSSPRKRNPGKRTSGLPKVRKGIYKCMRDGCNKHLNSEQVYYDHTKLHITGQFSCTFCEIVEENLINLSTHEYQQHSTTKSGRKFRGNHSWICPRCSHNFRSSLEYQTHFAAAHFKHFVDQYSDTPHNIVVEKIRKVSWQAVRPEELNVLKEFRCHICKFMFRDKTKLALHYWMIHQLNAKQQASITDDDVTNNMKTTILKSDELLKCLFCEDTFEHAPDLAVHETQHATQMFTQEKGQIQQNAERKKFQCPRCPYKYNRQAFYINHHMTNHLNILGNTLPGACTMCSGGKIFIPNTKDHYDRTHNTTLLDDPSKIVKCDVCSAYFLHSFQLYVHKKRIHQRNTFKCKFCDKTFHKNSTLKMHEFHVHKYSDEDHKLEFGCDIGDCKKRFMSLEELGNHKRFHRSITVCKERSKGDSTTCEVCGKVCKSKKALSVHKNIIHNRKTYVCHDCGKAFKTKCVLESHMLYHQSPDEWKFECAECGKKCATKHKLEQHERTHTKEKPFICQFCGEKYAHRHNWRNHLKLKHGDEEEAQEDIQGKHAKAQGASFMSRKGTKKGDCIITGKSVKV